MRNVGFNGKQYDDLRTRSGKVLASRSTYGKISNALGNVLPTPLPLNQVETAFFEKLYRDFGNSWRISQAESLFDYGSGQTTETFTSRNFPNSYLTLGSLLPAQIRAAEATCREAGVEADLLEGCIFDVGMTGDNVFAKSAANALVDTFKDELIDRVRDRLPNPIRRIPRLGF